MELLIPILLVTLLVGLVIIGWTLSLLGLPGNWLMLVAAAGFAWIVPGGNMDISWTTVMVIALLSVAGEIAETLASIWGAKRAGGSRRAAVLALIGSLVGAILGGALGLPIPLVGTPLGAIMGGSIGALVGAGLAEWSDGRPGQESWRVGHAAFWGRLLGTGVKTIIATAIAVLIFVSLAT